MEIFLSLQGIGLSLVNPVPIEISYVSLTGCVWHYHLFMLPVVRFKKAIPKIHLRWSFWQ